MLINGMVLSLAQDEMYRSAVGDTEKTVSAMRRGSVAVTKEVSRRSTDDSAGPRPSRLASRRKASNFKSDQPIVDPDRGVSSLSIPVAQS